MNSIVRKFSAPALAVAALFALAAPAQAITVYSLNVTSAPAMGLGPFGTVSLTQNGANEVDIEVALAAGFGFVNTGGPHTSFAFNLDVSGISINVTTPLVPSFNALAPATATPFGNFSNGLNLDAQNGGAGAYYGLLDFQVTRAGGISLADFIANDLGYLFAADVIAADGITTGSVASNQPLVPGIPEPETYALMLAGLGVIGFMARRRRAD